MIRIIVADDESVIIKGIQKLLDWNSLGIQIVGEYLDGKSALEGIVTLKPDIALLDINMPKMTGMELLKEICSLNLLTMVIFISGFQEFAFAKEALTYGAKDYILKPIIKEELMKALEKCIANLRVENELEIASEEKKADNGIPYEQLVEIKETTYLTVLFEILYKENENTYEKRLIRFSIHSFLEQYMENNGKGIVFIKNERIIAVLKGYNRQTGRELIGQLLEEINKATNHRVGAIIGKEIDSMGRIVDEYASCLPLLGYFFFGDQMKSLVVEVGKPVFVREVSIGELQEGVKKIQDAMILQDDNQFEASFNQIVRIICLISEGKKEDACFHFYNLICSMEEWYILKGLNGLGLDMKKILEEGRNTFNYEAMTKVFKVYLEQYRKLMASSIVGNEKKDILNAIAYIDKHYMEDLSLEVLAGVIHMNPSYFSTFFKKSTKYNFKDYLNKIRLEHAISLLLSTDYKVFDIAGRVGFRDARSFNKLFTQIYGETPANYRRRVSNNNLNTK